MRHEGMQGGTLLRESTFLVPAHKQRTVLHEFKKREQHFQNEYQPNKPLCFSARSYQRTHPGMMRPDANGKVHKDADAALVSPMMLGVADGVSSLGKLGIDGSELPNELLRTCHEIAISQLISDRPGAPHECYDGPIALLKEAYEATESLGSTTVLLSILDNSTIVHGTVHPMIAVLTIGDSEFVLLRRLHGRESPLEVVFHTEMQRIDDRLHAPMQLARVDERVDAAFDDEVAFEVIEKGSSVQCVSTREGDIVLMGSDGVFDNLFLEEILDTCNYFMPPPDQARTETPFVPAEPALLSQMARQIVHQSHCKTKPGAKRHLPDAPIGKGGKMDDTSVVVAELVEWSEDTNNAWSHFHRDLQWDSLFSCSPAFSQCGVDDHEDVIYPCSQVDAFDGAMEATCRFFEGSDDEEFEDDQEEEAKVLVDL